MWFISITSSIVKPQAEYDFIHGLRFRLPRPLRKTEIDFFRSNVQHFAIKQGRPIPGFDKAVVQLVLPNENALRLLAAIDGGRINYLEIARDLIFSPPHIPLVQALFDQQFVQPHHGKRETVIFQTVTILDSAGRAAIIISFGMRMSPVRVTGEVDCFYLEGRYQGVRAVEKAGVSQPSDLLDFDFTAYWNKHLKLYTVDRERLGRLHRNRQSGLRRRQAIIDRCGPVTYNRDYATGCVLYRHYARHPEYDNYSVQRFVAQYGRGAFLKNISLVIYGDERALLSEMPYSTAITCNTTPSTNDFHQDNHDNRDLPDNREIQDDLPP